MSLVSVIIISRNRHVLLQKAIDSVISQTYRPIEIVVIDNNSKEPVRLCRPLPTGITFILKRNDVSRTSAINRNLGITLVTGEFVCFLDDDDYYLPGKIPVLVKHLLSNQSISFVYSNTQMLGANGQDLGVCRGGGGILQLMLYRFVHMNSFLIKREALLDIRFDEKMTAREDVDFFFRVFEKCKFSHIDETFSVWNRDKRPDQLTHRNWSRSKKNWLILCNKHAHIIEHHKALIKFYYIKMFFLSVITGDMRTGIKYLLRIIGGLYLNKLSGANKSVRFR